MQNSIRSNQIYKCIKTNCTATKTTTTTAAATTAATATAAAATTATTTATAAATTTATTTAPAAATKSNFIFFKTYWETPFLVPTMFIDFRVQKINKYLRYYLLFQILSILKHLNALKVPLKSK